MAHIITWHRSETPAGMFTYLHFIPEWRDDKLLDSCFSRQKPHQQRDPRVSSVWRLYYLIFNSLFNSKLVNSSCLLEQQLKSSEGSGQDLVTQRLLVVATLSYYATRTFSHKWESRERFSVHQDRLCQQLDVCVLTEALKLKIHFPILSLLKRFFYGGVFLS